jgi:hypothetical protein
VGELSAAGFAGGCLCGQARYRSPGPALFALVCHCRDCQRASGSGGVPVLGVPRAGFQATGPLRQWRNIGGSGMNAVRNFCSECGSLLFGTPESEPDLVTIYAGSLDDPHTFRPGLAMFVAQRPDWASWRCRWSNMCCIPIRQVDRGSM